MKYSIKDTTREERKELVKNALGISIASNERPTDETINLLKEYVDGKIELKELQKQVIKKYKKN